MCNTGYQHTQRSSFLMVANLALLCTLFVKHIVEVLDK